MELIHRILLVEDDPYDIELTLNAFEQNKLLNDVMVVNDGEEALDYLYRRNKFSNVQSGNPAVILLDLKMPKVDGIEVLRQIKSDERLKIIPVVVLTSSRESRDLDECYKLGVNAYVVKPVQFDDFINAVKDTTLFWALINEPPLNSIHKKL